MFINDVNKKEEIRSIAVQRLKKYGIKHRDKNIRQIVQVAKTKHFFKVPLRSLENETVTLKNGQQLVVPKKLYAICNFILSKADTEGIFRKEGSKLRQNEIKLLLDKGKLLEEKHHVIDVAVILKCFLRELPEPLIPFSYHELFLRCSIIEKKVEAVLLACLLLPTEHLNVLAFLMQFFNEVASCWKQNKMNSYNISLLLGPNVFPTNDKAPPKNKLIVTKTCDIVKLMIDHSMNIGLIPDCIIEQIGRTNNAEIDKSKRRRSGSLTRIFHGLKKIVGNRSEEDTHTNIVLPDLLLTPSSPKNRLENKQIQSKKDKPSRRASFSSRTGLERRWSAITQATSFKRKKRESLLELPVKTEHKMASPKDYVQVPITEYEEIKNRVSAIEKRLSFELENAQAIVLDKPQTNVNVIRNIQSAYEHTLVHTEMLCADTNRIARRLSRELRIRNPEDKMIRSPSARKIGNIRRRSRDLENREAKHRSPEESKVKKTKLTRCASSPNDIALKYNKNLRPSSSFRQTFTSNSEIPCFSNVKLTLTENLEKPAENHPKTNLFKAKHQENVYENVKSLLREAPLKFSPDMKNVSPGSERALRERNVKQNVSPLRRNRHVRREKRTTDRKLAKSSNDRSNKENFGHENILNGNYLENAGFTPKTVPQIKRPVLLKSPKRLYNTPQKVYNVSTPLKVLPSASFY